MKINMKSKSRSLPPQTGSVSDEGSRAAFTYYGEMLREQGVKPVNHTEIQDGDPTCLEHLLWMCGEAGPQVRDDGQGMSVDKYSRWLGFIQGCLIMHGLTTVAAERDRTRPWFNK
jgi:hypothetical protein